MVSTSGTVSAYNVTNRKLVEHAARRAGFQPEKLSAEDLQVATDLLSFLTSEWANAGFPLWTRRYDLLGMTLYSPDVSPPTGTVDVLTAYWRIFMPYRGAATLSDGSGDTLLFGGQPNTDVTITGPSPSVLVNFTSPTETDTIGVLPGGSSSFTASLQIYASNDDATTPTLVQTLPSATYSPLQWTYFDLNPSITAQYLRILNPTSSSWVLNQLNFGMANGQDIELGALNIDDYYTLPDKQMQSDRPNSWFDDRKPINGPTMKIWPVPNLGAYYNGTVTALSRRYIQDPGTLSQVMELPQRWYEAIVWRLASRLIDELPDRMGADQQMTYLRMQDKQNRITRIEQQAAKSEAMAWGEERDRSPIRLMPSFACYTK